MRKNFIKKVLIVLIVSLSVGAVYLYASPTDVVTDSGFDSSYSSGGSSYSSGGSSYSSSSSSSSSSYGSNYDGSSGAGEFFGIGFVIIFIIMVLYFFVKLNQVIIDSSKNKNRVYYIDLNKKKAITAEEFAKYIKDETMEEFILKRFQDYLAVQYAWMEFKYDMLSNKTTNELYNQYQMQLETLKVKGQKNVMKDFLYVDGMITDISKVNNQTVVTVEIITRFYDYIINENSKVIIRGTDSKKISMHYRLVFVKDDNSPTPTHCPNCGAELKKTSTNVCEFCRTKITKETEDWLLSEKKAISQQ